MVFCSPAEIEFIRIFGGRYLSVGLIKDPKTGFPLTAILCLGKTLRREGVRHEVRCGAMWIDYAQVTPYSRKAIEIDGRTWHFDAVKQQRRDDYLLAHKFQVMHIRAASLFTQPTEVKRKVLLFLAR